jgi:GT2 family glycosyltransferase
VIPARDAAQTIAAQLAALASQSYCGRLHVVLADNGSTDATISEVERWRDQFASLRVVDASARRGAAFARNCGFGATSHTGVVVCCDADDVVDQHWVAGLLGALAQADLVAGGTVDWDGRSIPTHPNPFGIGGAGLGYLPACSTSSFACRIEVWKETGGFDEDLLASEDVDFAWRAQQQGFRLVPAPDAFVLYRTPTTARATFAKWFHYGISQPQLYAKHRRAGMPKQPTIRALSRWAQLAVTAFRLLQGGEPRLTWCREFGRRSGRVVGSVRARVVFL